eukprot:gene911-4172_t
MEEKVDNDADEQYQKDKSNEYVTFALDPKIRAGALTNPGSLVEKFFKYKRRLRSEEFMQAAVCCLRSRKVEQVIAVQRAGSGAGRQIKGTRCCKIYFSSILENSQYRFITSFR